MKLLYSQFPRGTFVAVQGKEEFFFVCLCAVFTATIKKIALAKKYSELKKSGKLEKFVEKKRRKNTKRDRKRLPLTTR